MAKRRGPLVFDPSLLWLIYEYNPDSKISELMELKAAKRTHWVRWREKNDILVIKDNGCRERMQNVNNVKGI